MIVVSILGGFGNQLSAYACAYSVARELNQPLVLDVADYYGGYFRPFALDLLSIPNHMKVYYPHATGYYHGVYGAPCNFMLSFDVIVDTNEIKSRKELIDKVADKKNIYIQGYGGLEFVTEEDKVQLKSLFQMKNINESHGKVIDQLLSCESVSIHIRRTDFINNGWDTDIDYYKAAIVYMETMLNNVELYIFSDDIEWAKSNLGNHANYHFVRALGGMEADIEEMYYMSACRHHILTNRSSYGYWAAFLSPYEDGINIINGNDLLTDVSNRHILNKERILELSAAYKEGNDLKNSQIDLLYLEKCLVENRNREVIDYIDKLSIDAWSVSKEIKWNLLECKGIAYLQEEEASTAISIFNNLQQWNRDSIDFCYNYAVALMKAGYRLESLVYSGRVMNIDENANVSIYLGEINRLEKEVLELVKKMVPKHYVFLNLPIYENVKGYYEAIAIMLRNLGNRVTVLELGNDINVINDSNFAVCMEKIRSTSEELDKVYTWGIKKYCIGKVEKEEGFLRIIKSLFDNLEDVVFVTHYIQGTIAKVTSTPLIFLDAISEWDAKKFLMSKYDASVWSQIYNAATKVITHRELPTEFENKKVQPYVGACVTGADEVLFCEERLLNAGFYMRNEECIWGMLTLLMGVADLD